MLKETDFKKITDLLATSSSPMCLEQIKGLTGIDEQVVRRCIFEGIRSGKLCLKNGKFDHNKKKKEKYSTHIYEFSPSGFAPGELKITLLTTFSDKGRIEGQTLCMDNANHAKDFFIGDMLSPNNLRDLANKLENFASVILGNYAWKTGYDMPLVASTDTPQNTITLINETQKISVKLQNKPYAMDDFE